MNRSLIILFGALALGAGIFAGAYFASQRACVMCGAEPTDNLAWLRDEFHLSDAEMVCIHQLHDGYEPKCMEMCGRIASKKRELEAALGSGTNLTVEAQNKLSELGELRAQCQAQMLQHFINVSQAMPLEPGKRYLAEMKKLTLGSQAEMESSMSDRPGQAHGHH